MSAVDPDLPKDPAAYRRRTSSGLRFGALVAFGVVCVLAGAGLAVLGPRLTPGKPTAAPLAAAPAGPITPAAETTLAVEVRSPTADEVVRLNARIASLETQGARTTEAAAAALAAAQLVDASQGSRPFARELAALRAAAPTLPELTQLARLAETGAPSRTALAASFPPYAAQAVRRAHKPPRDGELSQQLSYLVARIVTVRRIDETTGGSPDAVIARAEQALEEGEVVAALRALDGLPPRAREALEPWRRDAERRAEIDREIAALRNRAVRALQAPGPPA